MGFVHGQRQPSLPQPVTRPLKSQADYEAAKAQAKQWGATAVEAPDTPDQNFQAQEKPRQ